VLIDPEISQIDRYRALAARDGLRIRYVIDTHTHADHFSASQELASSWRAGGHAPRQPAPPRHAPRRRRHADRRQAAPAGAAHARPHARFDVPGAEDRVFTGDTLLIGGTGRTDLPTGDPDALYDSLFGKLLKLDPDCGSTRRTTTRAAATRPSGTRSPTTRGCRSASAPPSPT
jgi:glyoxylase-like metal-dependent hydrolase (beta-lactamase superfamily II)